MNDRAADILSECRLNESSSREYRKCVRRNHCSVGDTLTAPWDLGASTLLIPSPAGRYPVLFETRDIPLRVRENEGVVWVQNQPQQARATGVSSWT
jgi:hypothetical protein